MAGPAASTVRESVKRYSRASTSMRAGALACAGAASEASSATVRTSRLT